MMCSVANYDKAETSALFQNLFLELALLRALAGQQWMAVNS